MKTWTILVLFVFAAAAVVAQTAPAQPPEIRMNQGGFCYVTPDPIAGGMRIHAIVAGMAGKFGKMRGDMWQTMTFSATDGSVTVSNGRFRFTMFDMAPSGEPAPILEGSYDGSGPALNAAGMAEVTTPMVVTGGTGVFANAKGTGVVHGSALMPLATGNDWFSHGGLDPDFFNPLALAPVVSDPDNIGTRMAEMGNTPACAFRGDVELKLKYE